MFYKDLKAHVPQYYTELLESDEMLTADQRELARVNGAIDDLQSQWYVDTATWGLDEFERILGIKRQVGVITWEGIERRATTFNDIEGVLWSDLYKSFAATVPERRELIKAKLVGQGVTTTDRLIEIVRQFSNGTIEIVEDYANYSVTIRFVDENGVPSNMQFLRELIRDYLPAHIAVDYYVKYLTWSDVYEYKWEDLAPSTWAEVKGGLL